MMDKSESIATVDDAIKKLVLLDSKDKIWTQEMLLQVTDKAVRLLDCDTQVLLLEPSHSSSSAFSLLISLLPSPPLLFSSLLFPISVLLFLCLLIYFPLTLSYSFLSSISSPRLFCPFCFIVLCLFSFSSLFFCFPSPIFLCRLSYFSCYCAVSLWYL